MGFNNINESKLSVEQKIVLHLARTGYLTSGGDIQRALVDQKYAEYLITGNGLSDEFPGGEGDCDHEPLSKEEIEEVFNNDVE